MPTVCYEPTALCPCLRQLRKLLRQQALALQKHSARDGRQVCGLLHEIYHVLLTCSCCWGLLWFFCFRTVIHVQHIQLMQHVYIHICLYIAYFPLHLERSRFRVSFRWTRASGFHYSAIHGQAASMFPLVVWRRARILEEECAGTQVMLNKFSVTVYLWSYGGAESYSRSQKVRARPSSNLKPEKGTSAQILLHLCSNWLESTVNSERGFRHSYAVLLKCLWQRISRQLT